MSPPIFGAKVVPASLRTPLVADAIGLAGVLVVAVADWATGSELAFSAFYLLPIGYVTLYGHRGMGLATAVLAGGLLPLTEVMAGRVFSAPWLVPLNAVIRFSTFAVVVVLLRGLHRQVERADAMSRIDTLTGLLRGGIAREILGAELDRSRRYGRPMSIAYVDVDDFKRVNDTLGHAVGDAVLQRIARAMLANTRATDTCARLGGDEFLVLMPETRADAARASIERLRHDLAENGAGVDLAVTFSIGLATFHALPADAEEAIRCVDDLMYAAKRGGKNSYTHQVIGE